jgi:hypothetical protein
LLRPDCFDGNYHDNHPQQRPARHNSAGLLKFF